MYTSYTPCQRECWYESYFSNIGRLTWSNYKNIYLTETHYKKKLPYRNLSSLIRRSNHMYFGKPFADMTLWHPCSFYTRLFKIKDAITGQPVFSQLQVTLVCDQCKEDGLAASCKHMLHLVPQWQSSARHERLKEVMADRPDLIQSELAVRFPIPSCLYFIVIGPEH